MSTEQNKLGTTPIGRLLISMSIPMMISFFIQALYNMVDSMFVARISENALTAVSIAFPLQQIITAIGVGTGVAVNALVPRYTGQGQKDKALRIANVAVVLSFCYTILFMLVGVFGVPSLLHHADGRNGNCGGRRTVSLRHLPGLRGRVFRAEL